MDATPVLASQISRNPGIPLDHSWIEALVVNRSAVERRATTLLTRRTVKKQWQAAWLIRAIQCMDLTSLSGDDTPGRIERLCAKALRPVRSDLLEAVFSKIGDSSIQCTPVHVGAVCVYHAMVPYAIKALRGSGIPVAAVSTGFPAGLSPFKLRVAEIEESVALGAAEIDIVITRNHVLTSDWEALYAEVQAFRSACGAAHMKTILATGELGTLKQVAQASLVCMMAGADFIKTSTGKEPVNATVPVGVVMTRCIRDYYERTGYEIGFKPAGGIRSAKDALSWLILMKEELGDTWMKPSHFRLGASTLLSDIERQLEHFATGHYASFSHQPMA